MKLSILQIFAIVSILAFSCMTVAPFVQTADAGEVHYITVYEVREYVCEYCGTTIWREIIGSYTLTITHGHDEPHVYVVIYRTVERIPCGLCESCEEEETSS